jgi:hypothetical protein
MLAHGHLGLQSKPVFDTGAVNTLGQRRAQKVVDILETREALMPGRLVPQDRFVVETVVVSMLEHKACKVFDNLDVEPTGQVVTEQVFEVPGNS